MRDQLDSLEDAIEHKLNKGDDMPIPTTPKEPYFYYSSDSNTIRLMPQNYLVARHDGSRWIIDPDAALPLVKVLIATVVFHTADWKWANDNQMIVNLVKFMNRMSADDIIDKLMKDEQKIVHTGDDHSAQVEIRKEPKVCRCEIPQPDMGMGAFCLECEGAIR